MKYAGIDIASENHFVAIVDDNGEVIERPTRFTEAAEGYAKLLRLLGESKDVLVAMEATGHYWKNLFAMLTARGYQVAVVNPLSTRRHAQADLQRTKTDAVDSLGIACFAQQRKPAASRIPDALTDELKELVRLRDRLSDDLTSRLNELHRVLDLCFPEFTSIIEDIKTDKALTLIENYPSAAAFREARRKDVSNLKTGNRTIGLELADQMLAAAKTSVGQHGGAVYSTEAKYFCADIKVLKQRLKTLDEDIEQRVSSHPIAALVTSIDGIGALSAGRLVATFGDFSTFKSGKELASYVGVIPATNHSGKKTPLRAGMTNIGNADLRTALYMPTQVAVQRNGLLKSFYARLVNIEKKPKKVALIAAMNKLLHLVFSVAKRGTPFVWPLPKLVAAGT